MKINSNKLSDIGRAPCEVDKLSDLPFIPEKPLSPKNFAMYIVGSPGSGKTNLMLQLLMSHPTKKNRKKNRYHYGLFDNIYLISASMATLPKTFLNKLDEDRCFNKFSDQLLTDIIQQMHDGPNVNNLLVLDDCIRDLTRSKILSKLLLNRRHCSHNPEHIDDDGQGSVSVMITSQKYSLLPLEFRVACSDFAVFRSTNKMEINKLQDELCFDLDKNEFEHMLQRVWAEKYNFLFIKPNNDVYDKYYQNFNSISFD